MLIWQFRQSKHDGVVDSATPNPFTVCDSTLIHNSDYRNLVPYFHATINVQKFNGRFVALNLLPIFLFFYSNVRAKLIEISTMR